MDKLAHFEILNPPTKYIHQRKTKPAITYYLTNNVFYGGTVHWSVQRKVINYAKDSIIFYFTHIPEMRKCRLELIYHSPKAGFDLDNKAGFWIKMILDIMKVPSDKEIINAKNYGNKIKTVSVLPDDSCKYIDDIRMRYVKGAHKLEVIIHGILLDKQEKLF